MGLHRSSTRRAATCDRRPPPDAKTVRNSAPDRRTSTGRSPGACLEKLCQHIAGFLLFRRRGRALARTARRSADLSKAVEGPA